MAGIEGLKAGVASNAVYGNGTQPLNAEVTSKIVEQTGGLDQDSSEALISLSQTHYASGTQFEGNDDGVMNKVAAQANSGKPVTVLIQTPEDKGRYVKVTSIKEGTLTYTDPQDGLQHAVGVEAFRKSVKSISLEAPAPASEMPNARSKDKKSCLGKIGGAIKAVGKGVVKVGKSAMNAVVDVAKKSWTVLKKAAPYLMMAAQIACMVIPGLQPIAIGMMVYNAAKSGVQVVKGIKNGSWAQALGGVAGMVGSAIPAISGITGNVAGRVADIASKVATFAGKGAAVASSIQNKNWGGLIGVGAGLVADGAGWISDSAGATATKFAGYAQKFGAGLTAVQTRDVEGAVSAGLSLTTDVGKTRFGMGNKTADLLDKIGGYVDQEAAIRHGITNRDFVGVGNAAAQLVGKSDGTTEGTVKGLSSFVRRNAAQPADKGNTDAPTDYLHSYEGLGPDPYAESPNPTRFAGGRGKGGGGTGGFTDSSAEGEVGIG